MDIFNNLSKENLKKIHYEYLNGKNEGMSNKAFFAYAKLIRQEYGELVMSMSEAMAIAEKAFFEEVANRYFAQCLLNNK